MAGQTIANAPLGSFRVKTIYDNLSEAIQEVSTNSLLATRIDEGNTYMYLGYAQPGTGEAEPKWRISRFTLANVSGMQWADGNTYFDNVWNDRASLIYS